jgi:hypothetical protein
MQVNRQELLSSASRRIRRGRKTTGRIVVSALGFAVAYYFDSENGAPRRKQLHQTLHQVIRNVNGAMAPDAVDPPPVFHPVLRAPNGPRRPGRPVERLQVAR